MDKKMLAEEIIRRLKEEYPDAECSLDYNEAWKLLVSVRLAAQCTDARVNVVVEKLYEKFPDVKALAEASEDEIEAIVKPIEEMGEDADMMKFADATEATKERLYAAINRMFGGEVAGKLFGRLHPFTPVDGRFYFDRVLEVVGAQINEVFESEAAKFGAHVEKYTNRKQRRAKK